jgi:hypothetical protein
LPVLSDPDPGSDPDPAKHFHSYPMLIRAIFGEPDKIRQSISQAFIVGNKRAKYLCVLCTIGEREIRRARYPHGRDVAGH